MERMGAASEAQLIVELPKLFRFTHLLAMLRQLGTLLGLFGTITGFSGPGYSSVPPADATSRATVLARAIGEAMNCTALGLLVSTSAMAVAWVALRRGEDIQDELRLFTTGLQNLLITYRHRLRWNDARCDVEATSYR
jgi:biopolymer transport protein ExbB/TolQ